VLCGKHFRRFVPEVQSDHEGVVALMSLQGNIVPDKLQKLINVTTGILREIEDTPLRGMSLDQVVYIGEMVVAARCSDLVRAIHRAG
jgi:hypothetical protein